MNSSDATKVVCVGISQYRQRSLKLSYAAANALSFAEALSVDGGCEIPAKNLALLTDELATASAIGAALAQTSKDCGPDDILLFYFSGHGERNGDTFYLLPVEADPGRLPQTGLSAQQLRDCLTGCRARGVLLILDCCRSAGFAESADTFFRTLGSEEFRILLSASRAGQNSYEFPSQSGTIFSRRLTEAILGRPVLGDQPGVLYFSDLFAYLQKQMAEDLETMGLSRSAQETVFAGTYARDPRLFILKRATLEAIEAQTPLYSRKYVERTRRRVLLGVGVALSLTLGFYYYYLDHSSYVATAKSDVSDFEGDYLAVFAGDPKFNALGFPHLKETTDIPATAISAQSPPVVARWGGDVLSKFMAALDDDWQAVVAGWQGRYSDTASLIARKVDDIDLPDDPEGLKVAVDILGEGAGPENKKVLEDNAEPMAPGRGASALRHLASFDPQRAVDLYTDGMEGEDKLQLALLQGLRGDCLEDEKEIFAGLAKVTYDINQGKSLWAAPDPRRGPWWAALIRTGCRLPSEIIIDVYDHEVYRDNDRDFNVLAYMLRNPDAEVIGWIKRDLERRAADELSGKKSRDWRDNMERGIRIWSDMRMLAASRVAYDQATILKLTRSDLDKDIKLGAGRLLMSDASFDRKVLVGQANGDLWLLALLVDGGWYDDAVVREAMVGAARRSKPELGSNFAHPLKYLMRMIRRKHVSAGADTVRAVGEAATDAEVRVDASRTLDQLAPRERPDGGDSDRSKFFLSSESANIFTLPKPAAKASLGESRRYYVSRYDQGFVEFMINLGDSVQDDAEAIAGAKLSEQGLAKVRSLLSDPKARWSAAAILAMVGNETDLLAILSSPDLELRQEAMKYAIYNPAVAKVVDGDRLVKAGRQAKFYLQRQIRLKAFIEEFLAREPMPSKGLVLRLLLEGSWAVSPGLKLWGRDVLESLDGSVEDDAAELSLFDAR
jgi:uncharacterized caspase-like protein